MRKVAIALGLASLVALLSYLQPESKRPTTSADPIETVIATGNVKEERIEPTNVPNKWIHVHLLMASDSRPSLRIVEHWEEDPQQGSGKLTQRKAYIANQLLVRIRSDSDFEELRGILKGTELSFGKEIAPSLCTVVTSDSTLDALPRAIDILSSYPEIVDTAEGDGYGFGGGDPNDSRFYEQWGLKNTGQDGGTAGADVNAEEFWTILDNAPDVVVAVLDSGLNFDHPDLQNISWHNPSEIAGDGIDNDGNGFADDLYGWDFVNDDNDPRDDHGHGSNVTGIIAANRNNHIGIAGMLSGVQILSCKILNSNNGGSTSDLIAGIRYARQQGVTVMNLSLQSYPYSKIIDDEFTLCEEQGIILSICGGNQGGDNDLVPNYPSSYTHANIIAVANHDRRDERWAGSFNPSNYGKESIDLFAPGRRILSPTLNNSYSAYTGTSQAAPFVAAVCAAIKQINPDWTAPQIKSAILDTVARNEIYANESQTGGRLDAAAALSYAIVHGRDSDNDGDGFSDQFELLAGSRLDLATDFPTLHAELTPHTLSISVLKRPRQDLAFEAQRSTDLKTWVTANVVNTLSLELFQATTLLHENEAVFLRIRPVPNP